jgi:hypothetical protein
LLRLLVVTASGAAQTGEQKTSKESTMVSHTLAYRYRGPVTILLVLAVLGWAGSPAWGRIRPVLGTLGAALRGPAYTVAQL